MRKIIVGFVTTLTIIFTLFACSQGPEVVDITTLNSSPEKYVGKRIRFYLDAVQDRTGMASEFKDPTAYLMSFDTRMGNDFKISVMLKPNLLAKWEAANLDNEHEYTVTVTGNFTSMKLGKLTAYHLITDDFVINSESKFNSATYSGSKTTDGLPSETIDIPRPTRVLDVNKIGLFPDQFKSKSLMIEAMVGKDDFKPGAGDAVHLRTSSLTFVLNKKMAADIYDKVTTVAYLEIVGTLDAAKAADGSPMIVVKHLRFLR